MRRRKAEVVWLKSEANKYESKPDPIYSVVKHRRRDPSPKSARDFGCGLRRPQNASSCEALTSRSLRIVGSTDEESVALTARWRRDPSPQRTRLRISAAALRLRSGLSLAGARLRQATPAKRLNLSVILPRGFHPFPSRTRKLSPAGPIVLHAKVCGRVGHRRHK